MSRRLLGSALVLAVLVSLASAGSSAAAAPGGRLARVTTGQGRLFVPNAIVALRDDTIKDRKDADYPVLRAAYSVRS